MELTNDTALNYILAGNAIITLTSLATNHHFTYRIEQPDDHTPHFVWVLAGLNNTRDYIFLGTIFDRKRYAHGKKSPINPSAPSTKAFAWAWRHILSGTIPDTLVIQHEGRCGKCGRRLTDPVSIERGIGPVCHVGTEA
jgi:hypothetical protein